MGSFWHNTVLGKYNPQDRWVGLDFRNLFLDPLSTKLTHIHELTHSVLSRSTDFGLATEVIFQLLPKMKHLSPEDKEIIRNSLMGSQLFTQEGTASLMEVLRLKQEIGKQSALRWAKEHFTEEYYKRFELFLFVLDFGQSYRDSFTMHIPHIAMHTGIRRAIVEHNLLSDAKVFSEYLKDNNNNPDFRLQKMMEIVKYKPHLPTKTPQEICNSSGITYFNDVTKQDAADFLNYVHKLAGNNIKVLANQIKDSKDVDVLSDANDQIIIANMNLNLEKNATILWKIEDILHYRDKIETVMVNQMVDDLEYKDLIEQLIGKKLEAALVAFLTTGEKFMFGSDTETISHLITNELANSTLLVKWGLYRPGEKELLYFANSRKPDVTLYNTAKNLDESFQKWFSEKNKVEYIFLSASKDHPFQTLVIKEPNGVLHFLNTFNRPASDFLKKYSEFLIRVKPKDFLDNTKHFNNALSVWGGMPFEVDWYKSMIDGKSLIYR